MKSGKAGMADLVPAEFYLGQNYPNPFRERTKIKYCVALRVRVTITIYGSRGEVVQRLEDDVKEPGTYEVAWEPNKTIHGTYKYEMKAAGYTAVKRMKLLK